MSYQINITGHADSKEGEARALAAAADCAEAADANGSFTFAGQHFSITAGAPQDAVARARAALEAYNAAADADDQVVP